MARDGDARRVVPGWAERVRGVVHDAGVNVVELDAAAPADDVLAAALAALH
jgi:hypothetical protein